MSKALEILEQVVNVDEIVNSAPLEPLDKAGKLKAATAVEKSLNKEYKQTLVSHGKSKVGQVLPSYPFGLPTVDYEVIACGGAPKGRIIEIFGPESSGKTTIALQIIAETQKRGGVAAFIDAEHALMVDRAAQLGVDMDELLISQPDYGEQALEVALALVEARAVDLIVIDSVTALVPLAELEGDFGDSNMGMQARLMSQSMRKLVGICNKNGVTIVFINQIREKVGVMFGSPEVTTGGRALKFFSSVRLEVRRVAKSNGGTIEQDNLEIGHKIRVKAVKNKVAAPFRETVVSLYYDERGFDVKDDMVQHAINLGVVEPGAWHVFESKKYRRGDLTEGAVFDKLVSAVEKARADKYKEAI